MKTGLLIAVERGFPVPVTRKNGERSIKERKDQWFD